jgi:hypothetical protein
MNLDLLQLTSQNKKSISHNLSPNNRFHPNRKISQKKASLIPKKFSLNILKPIIYFPKISLSVKSTYEQNDSIYLKPPPSQNILNPPKPNLNSNKPNPYLIHKPHYLDLILLTFNDLILLSHIILNSNNKLLLNYRLLHFLDYLL